MAQNYILGCSCGFRVPLSAGEKRTEIRCPSCKRYIKIPPLKNPLDLTTQALVAASQDYLVGKVLSKRYRLESYLADGAMGRVYRGTDLLLHIPVAVKILKTRAGLSERQEQRFIQEAKIASGLLHPGIVMVRNLHRSQKGGYFMVMDYCPGKSLKTILATRQCLSPCEAVEIIVQILSALKAAHAKGVVHRDIKPGNIMIEETPQGPKVRILDFGIAKVFSHAGGLEDVSLTKTGFIVGTTHYMAPEQILKEKLSAQTDIYSVGILFYNLVTGQPPFRGSREKVLRAIVRENPPSLWQALQKTGDSRGSFILDSIIRKAIAKDSKNRFKNTQAFLNALLEYRKGGIIPFLKGLARLLHNAWVGLEGDIRKILGLSLLVLLLMPCGFYLQAKKQQMSANPHSQGISHPKLLERIREYEELEGVFSKIETLLQEGKYNEALELCKP